MKYRAKVTMFINWAQENYGHDNIERDEHDYYVEVDSKEEAEDLELLNDRLERIVNMELLRKKLTPRP